MNKNGSETNLLLGILSWIFFPTLIFLVILYLCTGGKTIHQVNNEKLESIEAKIESMKEGTGFNEIKFYTNKYNDHDYIIVVSWQGRSTGVAAIHSPDCECLKNK